MADRLPPPFLGASNPEFLLPAGPPGPRVVVTGGAGFVGGVLVRWLLAAGYRVHVVDCLMYGGGALLPVFIHPSFSFSEMDILDRDALARELEGADAVIHLAAYVGYPLCKQEPERATAVNVQGTRNVLDLSPSHVPLLYASTGSNYGEVAGVCTEDTPLNPLSLYGENKTIAERMCMERPNTVSFRFATAFGLAPRLRLDLMINDFTHQALVRRYLLVYERHFRRTFIHVQDMARAFVHTLQNFEAMKNLVYNIGDDSMNFTKEDITGMLSDRTEYLLYFADIGSDEDKRDYAVSYDRVRATGYRTMVTMEHGLDELIAGLRLVRIRNPHSNV